MLLAQYLTTLGFSPFEVGAIVTGTLLGSAALTLSFGLAAQPVALRSLLLVASVVMVATGLGFAAASAFWLLMVIAVIGTLNPTAGDVSVFLRPSRRSSPPKCRATPHRGVRPVRARGALRGVRRLALSRAEQIVENIRSRPRHRATTRIRPLRSHRCRSLLPLPGLRSALDPQRPRGASDPRDAPSWSSPLFSFDSAGGGFVVTSILVLWLQLRFDLSPGVTAGVFFAAGLLAGCSQLLAPKLALRIGLIRTMAFTHMPANVALILAAFAPTGGIAIALLLARALVSQLDVPARQAFVMTLVPEEHRPAAASVTNVPRSLAAATTPLLAGALLEHSTFGWPLVIAGVTKLTYDVVLLVSYRHVPEVEGASRRLR